MDCTLKVNMILEDGKHYNRGTVLDIDRLPEHLRTREYITKGVVHINKLMPIDMVEIKDGPEDEEEKEGLAPSPMKELTISDLREIEEQEAEEEEEPSSKKHLKRIIRKK